MTADTPSTSSKRPVPAIGLRRRQRVSGEAFLCGVVDEHLVLERGTQLDLRRVAVPGKADVEYVLLVIPPPHAVALKEAQAAAADRRDASLLRQDPRDDGEQSP